jgi:hypothetical protein
MEAADWSLGECSDRNARSTTSRLRSRVAVLPAIQRFLCPCRESARLKFSLRNALAKRCLPKHSQYISSALPVTQSTANFLRRIKVEHLIHYILKLFPSILTFLFCFLKKLSVALVRKRTIPYRPTATVGEVSANFLRIEGVAWSAQRIPTAVNFSVF